MKKLLINRRITISKTFNFEGVRNLIKLKPVPRAIYEFIKSREGENLLLSDITENAQVSKTTAIKYLKMLADDKIIARDGKKYTILV